MRPSDKSETLTDLELNQVLSAWTVPVPTNKLRERIFGEMRAQVFWEPPFAAITAGHEGPWYQKLFAACSRNRPFAAALVLQACAVAFCFVTVAPTVVRTISKQTEAIFLAPYRSPRPPAANQTAGGGGGGQHAQTPVTQGAAPKYAVKTFIPPALAVPEAKLPVAPTLNADAPQIEANNYGDPLSKITGLSPGQGFDGMGDGDRNGVGSGKGNGYRDGAGGGWDGGSYTIGGDVSAPVLVAKFEPEYSDEARRARFSGTVLLSVVVDENGIPRNIRVIRSVGLGLDQKAIDAVQRWRFRPGHRHGRAVPVQAAVEVSFRLL